jgi:hypothetical protein
VGGLSTQFHYNYQTAIKKYCIANPINLNRDIHQSGHKMDDSKIFSSTHEAYKENFQVFKMLGVFGIDNPTKKRKLWLIFIVIAIFCYPIATFIYGYKTINKFSEFIEHTAIFAGIIDTCIRLSNIKIWRKKIIEIATLFKEFKKFDENEMVRKKEVFAKRLANIWLVIEILFAIFYCFIKKLLFGKNTFLEWIQFEDDNVTMLVGIADWIIMTILVIGWINSQTFLFMAYTQLTAHLKCLIVRFSKIGKPKSAEDSKKNLEKLHEIIEIHQKLKR